MDVCEKLNMKYNARVVSARECERYEQGDSKRTIYFQRPNLESESESHMGRNRAPLILCN